MRGIAKIGCGLLLVAAIAGCSRSVDTVQVGDSLGNEYKWIQTDAGIGKTARVVSAKKARTDTGLLQVQVELYSVRHNDAKFVYKFVWLDAKGMEINSITNDMAGPRDQRTRDDYDQRRGRRSTGDRLPREVAG